MLWSKSQTTFSYTCWKLTTRNVEFALFPTRSLCLSLPQAMLNQSSILWPEFPIIRFLANVSYCNTCFLSIFQ